MDASVKVGFKFIDAIDGIGKEATLYVQIK